MNSLNIGNMISPSSLMILQMYVCFHFKASLSVMYDRMNVTLSSFVA